MSWITRCSALAASSTLPCLSPCASAACSPPRLPPSSSLASSPPPLHCHAAIHLIFRGQFPHVFVPIHASNSLRRSLLCSSCPDVRTVFQSGPAPARHSSTASPGARSPSTRFLHFGQFLQASASSARHRITGLAPSPSLTAAAPLAACRFRQVSGERDQGHACSADVEATSWAESEDRVEEVAAFQTL